MPESELWKWKVEVGYSCKIMFGLMSCHELPSLSRRCVCNGYAGRVLNAERLYMVEVVGTVVLAA